MNTLDAEVQTYCNGLLLALRLRDVPGPRIAEALAEVQSHVSETGEDPREAFGPPAKYADELTVALGGPSTPFSLRRLAPDLRRGAAYGLSGAAGAWFLLDGVSALSSDQDGVFGLPAAVPLLFGVTVLIGMIIAQSRLFRASNSRVVDPRTGIDMAAPLPRWVLPVMLTAPILTLVLAAAVLVAAQR